VADVLIGLGVILFLLGIAVRVFSRRRGNRLLLAAVLMLIVGSISWSHVPGIGRPPRADSVEECRDVAFVGLRGSGEKRDDHDGYGEVVGPMRDRLRRAVLAQGRTFADLPVDYPALAVMGNSDWSLGKDLLLSARTGHSLFLDGAMTGADLAQSQIERIDATCGERTRIVAAGYSQGAMALHLALEQLNPRRAGALVSVDLFADPLRSRGEAGPDGMPTAPGAGVARLVLTGDAADVSRYHPRSWCLSNDRVCAGTGALGTLRFVASGFAVHVRGYQKHGIPAKAAADAAATLR
jgi:hypothetical protein